MLEPFLSIWRPQIPRPTGSPHHLQIRPGRLGRRVEAEQVPGQDLNDDAWVLIDGTDFGMGILLEKQK